MILTLSSLLSSSSQCIQTNAAKSLSSFLKEREFFLKKIREKKGNFFISSSLLSSSSLHYSASLLPLFLSLLSSLSLPGRAKVSLFHLIPVLSLSQSSLLPFINSINCVMSLSPLSPLSLVALTKLYGAHSSSSPSSLSSVSSLKDRLVSILLSKRKILVEKKEKERERERREECVGLGVCLRDLCGMSGDLGLQLLSLLNSFLKGSPSSIPSVAVSYGFLFYFFFSFLLSFFPCSHFFPPIINELINY